MISADEREWFRQALLEEGWVAVVATPDGITRLPVWGFEYLGDTSNDPEDPHVGVRAVFLEEHMPPDGSTILDLIHPRLKPESEQED